MGRDRLSFEVLSPEDQNKLVDHHLREAEANLLAARLHAARCEAEIEAILCLRDSLMINNP